MSPRPGLKFILARGSTKMPRRWRWKFVWLHADGIDAAINPHVADLRLVLATAEGDDHFHFLPPVLYGVGCSRKNPPSSTQSRFLPINNSSISA